MKTINANASVKVTGNNDSAEKQQFSLPKERNEPGLLNIQEIINLSGSSKLKEKKSSQMCIKIPSVTSIADGIGISDRAFAAIVSAALLLKILVYSQKKTKPIS